MKNIHSTRSIRVLPSGIVESVTPVSPETRPPVHKPINYTPTKVTK